MKQISQIFFGLLTFLMACKVDKKNVTDQFPIPDPRLVDYDTSDINIKRAITKTKDYLAIKETDVNLTDFYLDSLYVKRDTIVLMINHIDAYEIWRAMKEDEKRQKEMEARGDALIEIYVPPTGNWSGRDRAILYLVKKDSIIDVLYQ